MKLSKIVDQWAGVPLSGNDGEVIFALSYIEIAHWALKTNFGHFQGYQVTYWPVSCQKWGIGRWIRRP